MESKNTHYLGSGFYVNSYDEYYPMYVEKGKDLKRVSFDMTEMKDGKTTKISKRVKKGRA